MATMNRRAFLASATVAASTLADTAAPTMIVDTHAHFYDPARPGGVPWPPKDDKVLYRTVLPAEYRRITQPLGITGVIEVEASPWVEDNQWVLNLAAKNPVLIGSVGNLEPGKPNFRENLTRFHKNRLFLGMRFGYLWGRSLAAELPKPEFISDLKFLAETGLELDAVGGPSLLAEVVRITDQVPNLRIVIDHLPYDPPAAEPTRSAYQAALRELGKRPQVYVKVSNVLRRSGGRVPTDVNFYRPSLDELWDIFGPNRLLYGSNWPVSDLIAPYEAMFRVVRAYFAGKGREATEKYFWKNSKAVYRWSIRA
jgi:L-fuconolactonase